MKNSWISCARPEPGARRRAAWRTGCLGVLLVLACLAASAQEAERINPFLGPQYASWMVGAVGAIATEAEQREFLLLEDDEGAAEFVESFWNTPGRREIKAIYDQRFAEAERRFAEGVYPGGRSDRGTVYILYGEPETIEYEEFRDIDEPDVEVWRYQKKAERGLDGERPARQYRFVKVGDRTRRFDRGDRNDPTTRRRRIPRTTLPFDQEPR